MKDKLLELIEQTDEMEKMFHSTYNEFPSLKIIYDVKDFISWQQAIKAELNDLLKISGDNFIFEVICDLDGFNGWTDKLQFNKVRGKLFVIKDRIDSYYAQEDNEKRNGMNISTVVMSKKPKIFISHSSKDVEYVDKFVDLLEDIGLRGEQIFCSSVPGYDIPLGKNIFDKLLSQFKDYKLHVIFILSKNFYDSPVCLNEMGAAWALSAESNFILLPGFDFTEIKGVIDKDNIGIKLDGENRDLRNKLNQLKDNIIQEFNLSEINSVRWEDKRNKFIQGMIELPTNTNSSKSDKLVLSPEAEEILKESEKNKDGQIIITSNLQSGKTINYGSRCHSESEGSCEFSRWDAAIKELLRYNFIQARGKKNEVFVITYDGYKYLDSNK